MYALLFTLFYIILYACAKFAYVNVQNQELKSYKNVA